MCVQRTQRQTDGEPQAFAYNCSFQKDTVTIGCYLTRYNLIGEFFDTRVVAAFVCKTCNLCEYFSSDVCYRAVNSAHRQFLSVHCRITPTGRLADIDYLNYSIQMQLIQVKIKKRGIYFHLYHPALFPCTLN